MKTSAKFLIAAIAIAVSSSAFSQHHRNQRQQYGCGSNCAVAAVLTTLFVGAVIANEQRQPNVVYVQPQQPQPVFVQQEVTQPPVLAERAPRIIYVPSRRICDGGIYINNAYYCPVLR